MKICRICACNFDTRGLWCQSCVEKYEQFQVKVKVFSLEVGIQEIQGQYEPISGYRLICEGIESARIIFHIENWRDKNFCPFTIGEFVYNLGETVDKGIPLSIEHIVEKEEGRDFYGNTLPEQP